MRFLPGIMIAILLGAGVLGASADDQKDPLRIAWQSSCVSPAADSTVVCVPTSDAGLGKLGDYSTVRVSLGQAPERRFQLLPSAESRWRVLVESPGISVCDVPSVNARPVCGPVARSVPVENCQAAADLGAGPEGSATCTLRPTPYDNPNFPHFPDPETAVPGYFAPWPAYGEPGGTPGDLDKLFFANLEALSELASAVPPVAAGTADVLTPAQRRQLEILAWQEFIALNWPVDDNYGETRVNPAGVTADAGACPVWAGWRRRDEVIRGTARLPIPWGLEPTADGSSPICNGFRDGAEIAMLSATSGPLGSTFGTLQTTAKQPDGRLLFDRNGHLVFYDVRINRVLYDYILREALYLGKPPRQPIEIPHGRLWPAYGLGLLKAPDSAAGPVVVKFAWKQLTSCDEQNRFLLARTALGTVKGQHAVDNMRASNCTPTTDTSDPDHHSAEEKKHLAFLDRAGLLESAPAEQAEAGSGPHDTEPSANTDHPSCKPLCSGEVCLLGLVAMHIGHKTSTNPSWNWATFMHRDALASGETALFDTDGCEEDRTTGGEGGARSCNECEEGRCVTRVCGGFHPMQSTQALNREVTDMLAGAQTPLFKAASNYELLGVQWIDQTGPGKPRAVPENLLNPLMETFVTDPDRSSCYSCHVHAKDGDFLFFLSRNVPKT